MRRSFPVPSSWTPARRVLAPLALALLVGVPAPALFAEDPPAPTAAAEEEVKVPWVRNWEEARAQARKDGKDLLINFTGSDWCGWCKRLEAEVFAHKEFLDTATKQFVFVFLDFPRAESLKKEVVDPELNDKLNQAYGVEGFPTIVLADAEGRPFARTGYQQGGPPAYLEHLKELGAAGAKVKALLGAKTPDADALKAGIEALDETGFLGYPDYAPLLAAAEKADADGSKGLKALVEKQKKRDRARGEEQAIKKLLEGVTSKEQVPWAKLYAALLESKDLGGNMLFQLANAVADWLVTEKRFDDALALLKLPLRDPEIAGHPNAKEALDKHAEAIEKARAEDAAPKEEPAPEAPKDAPNDEPK